MRSRRLRWVAEMMRTSTRVDLVGAERLDRPLLQHAQQLGLRRQRHLGDLVEQQRAAVGRLEAAVAALDRAGERAALVAEQLRLEQRLRERRAVDGDERLARARVLRSCSVRATSSLPVPLSPVISTGASLCAMVSMRSDSRSIGGLRPMIAPRAVRAPPCAATARRAPAPARASARAATPIRSICRMISSMSNGLVM